MQLHRSLQVRKGGKQWSEHAHVVMVKELSPARVVMDTVRKSIGSVTIQRNAVGVAVLAKLPAQDVMDQVK